MNSARWGLDGTETAVAHDGEARLGEALAARKQGTRRCGKQWWCVGTGGGGCGGSLWWLFAWKSCGSAGAEEFAS